MNDTIVVVNQQESKSKTKFPFIDRFVEAMHHINGHELVTSDMDKISLVFFFNLYINSCKCISDNNQELTIENINYVMKSMYSEHLLENTVTNVVNPHKLLDLKTK